MPDRTHGVLKNRDNVKILNALRNEASMSYRQLIPWATQENINETLDALTRHKAALNEFQTGLINRIGKTISYGMSFNNPLAVFKKGMLVYGETVQELQTGLIQAESYSAALDYTDGDIYRTQVPNTEANYHTRNRQDVFRITVNQSELTKAFLAPNGVSDYISKLMSTPTTSDNLAEFKLMTSLFAQMNARSPFFKVQIPNLTSGTSTKDQALQALKKIRTVRGEMIFPSTRYNAAGFEMGVQPSEMVLFATPGFFASIDVDALAQLFHLEKADVGYRTIELPESAFNIPGCQAILTTDRFFQVYDTYFDIEDARNPLGRYTNYFLHHDAIISASRFAPVVMFTTEAGTPVAPVEPLTAATVSLKVFDGDGNEVAAGGNVVRGMTYRAVATLTATTPALNSLDGVSIPVDLSASGMTHNRRDGVFTIHGEETAASVEITPKVKGNYETAGLASSFQLTSNPVKWAGKVTGKKIPDWPVQG